MGTDELEIIAGKSGNALGELAARIAPDGTATNDRHALIHDLL
jgi:hypothetical protein